MKILHLVQKPQRRGAELATWQLSRALRQQGHGASIVYLYPHAGADLPLSDEDCCLHGNEAHPLERTLGWHPALLKRVLRQIDHIQPNIVQANGARTVKYGALARRLRPRAGWRLVYRNIGNPQDWVRTPAHRLFYRRVVMPQVDGIVGWSRTTLAGVLTLYDIQCPHVVIGGAIDPCLLEPTVARDALRHIAQTSPDAPVLIYVGSLAPEKRVDRLLRLMARLLPAHPELRCWIVGDGPLRGELETLAARWGIGQAVRFWGTQPRVGNYLHAADLFVLTSDTEGVPMAVLEAGYMGLPVVATDVGGVAECVRHGQTGLLVPRKDEEALVTTVGSLLTNATARQVMGAAAHSLVSQNYLIDQILQQYLAFYSSLLGNSL
jgi:glycosyltransferase involved in cell wall biosynthesis